MYITYTEYVNTEFYDGDATLWVTTVMDGYPSTGLYYVPSISVSFDVHKEQIEGFSSTESEVIWKTSLGLGCSMQVWQRYEDEQNDERESIITESYYEITKSWDIKKYWHYSERSEHYDKCGYTTEDVLVTEIEWQDPAPGVGMNGTDFCLSNEMRYHNFMMYAQQIFPYVDLWLSGNWNEGIENIAPVQ